MTQHRHSNPARIRDTRSPRPCPAALRITEADIAADLFYGRDDTADRHAVRPIHRTRPRTN